MQKITEAIAANVPIGRWCHGWRPGATQAGWCRYHERKKPSLSENGSIQVDFCNLQEEFVNRKTCGFNELGVDDESN